MQCGNLVLWSELPAGNARPGAWKQIPIPFLGAHPIDNWSEHRREAYWRDTPVKAEMQTRMELTSLMINSVMSDLNGQKQNEI
ncbi:hypothetical protein PF006_g32048 [Phytophthora fragariae]|uniref:Uncharacterized protein n=1 Tax=Phytophthora fragariae TaxID=53985 RepID=A0A6A3PTV0_9STRA|nr:hypothetical protein PF006_g32048 [Phytophthora fragariae]